MPSSAELQVAGFTRCSSCDWPGKLVATVFCQGCPWDCTYCHNPELLDARRPGVVPWTEVVELMGRRRGLLDGLVFSGGEATRQDLRPYVEEIRALGFAVGLHTSGAFPHRLAELLPVLDWVGFDVKALPANYAAITGIASSATTAMASLHLLLGSGVDYQVRTTWGPGVMTHDQALTVIAWLRSLGVHEPVLQPLRTNGVRPAFLQLIQDNPSP